MESQFQFTLMGYFPYKWLSLLFWSILLKLYLWHKHFVCLYWYSGFFMLYLKSKHKFPQKREINRGGTFLLQ